MTELYIADEVFISGTSAYIAPVREIDGRVISTTDGVITSKIREKMQELQKGE
jgi:branched-chain amino acid aminotransferase